MIDRNEFELRLKQIFCFTCLFDTKACVKALIDTDTEQLSAIQAVKTKMEGCIADYLTRWDNAEDDAARMAIVGSVQSTDYENF